MEALGLDIKANTGNWIRQDHLDWWQLEIIVSNRKVSLGSNGKWIYNQRTLYLHPASNLTLEAARKGHYRTVLHGVVSWFCSRESHFFFLLPADQGSYQHLSYHRRKYPFHIAMRCITSEKNAERSNKDSLKVKKTHPNKKNHIFVIWIPICPLYWKCIQYTDLNNLCLDRQLHQIIAKPDCFLIFLKVHFVLVLSSWLEGIIFHVPMDISQF